MKYLILVGAAAAFLAATTTCGQTQSSGEKKEFSKADLQKLRWIEGTWRGSENGQGGFYERYRFANDDVLENESLGPDLTPPKDGGKGSVYISDGNILHRGGSMVWIATALDDKSIHFAPKENASNSFSWEKESADVWIARIKFTDSQGKPVEHVYRMERVKLLTSDK